MYSVLKGVFTHQYNIQRPQGEWPVGAELKPEGLAVGDPQGAGLTLGYPVTQGQILLLEIPEGVAPALSLQQHGQGTVFCRVDAPDGVHYHPKLPRAHAVTPIVPTGSLF